jgi:hypothetical protein
MPTVWHCTTQSKLALHKLAPHGKPASSSDLNSRLPQARATS